MSGPPHTFQTSFANAQQAVMRTQFVGAGGPQIPGLMTPNQQAGYFIFLRCDFVPKCTVISLFCPL